MPSREANPLLAQRRKRSIGCRALCRWLEVGTANQRAGFGTGSIGLFTAGRYQSLISDLVRTTAGMPAAQRLTSAALRARSTFVLPRCGGALGCAT